jgi:hypothetical protein
MWNSRPEYNTPEYKAWRYAVFARDHFTCQLCMRKGEKINAHHIIRWADAPQLRFVVSNGITLCFDCHDNLVTGREAEFAPKFREIVAQKKIQEIKKREAKTGRKVGGNKSTGSAKRKYKPRNPFLRF